MAWVSERLSTESKAESQFSHCFPIREVNVNTLPFLGPGKSAFLRIGSPKGPIVLDFDEVTIVGEALDAIRAGECDGGVEGGVSSSSDDEGESAQEEVSEMREGVREIRGLAAGGNDGSLIGNVVALI